MRRRRRLFAHTFAHTYQGQRLDAEKYVEQAFYFVGENVQSERQHRLEIASKSIMLLI